MAFKHGHRAVAPPPPGARAPTEKRTMRIDDAGFYKYAVLPYNDPRAFLRELIQNGMGTGAKHITISIDRETITVQDDGSGMSREFIETDYRDAGRDFSAGNTKGMYGVGRFSVFGPITKLVDDKVEYYGWVEMITADCKRQTKVTWSNMRNIDKVEDQGPSGFHGTVIKIHFNKKPLPFALLGQVVGDQSLGSRDALDFFVGSSIAGRITANIKKYLGELITTPTVEITLITSREAGGTSNHSVPSPYNFDNTYQEKFDIWNNFVKDNVSYGVWICVDPKSDKLVISEEGIKVAELHNEPIGGIIDFDMGAYKGEKTGIHSMSRDSLTINWSSAVDAFHLGGVIPYYRRLRDPFKQEELSPKVVKWAGDFFQKVGNKYSADALRFPHDIVWDGKPLGMWAKGGIALRAVYDGPEAAVARAKGKHVFITGQNTQLDKILAFLNIEEVTEYKEQKEYEYVYVPATGAIENTLSELFEYLMKSQLYSAAAAGVGDNQHYREDGSGDIASAISHEARYHEKAQKLKRTCAKLDHSTKVLGTMESGEFKLLIVAYEDKDVDVLHSKGVMALNYNNEAVRLCIDRGRFQLLLPIVAHGMVHSQGFAEHNPSFLLRYGVAVSAVVASRKEQQKPVAIDAMVMHDGDRLVARQIHPLNASRLLEPGWQRRLRKGDALQLTASLRKGNPSDEHTT